MKFLTTLTLLFTTTAILAAQPAKQFSTVNKPEDANLSSERLKRIDRMIESHVAKNEIPGAVVLLIRDGKIAYYKAFGYSDVDKKTPLQTDNIFRIASQTKAITSLAVMMLWEEGKFLLDEPVSKYIPEFRAPQVLKTFNANDTSYTTEPARSEITIRHLLTHTSGLDYPAIGNTELRSIYSKAKIPSGIGNHNFLLADKIKTLATLPLRHHPGERWTYGLNTDVLGRLIEIWSGMSFDKFIKTRICDPIGMTDTYFYLPKEKHNRLVRLYTTNDDKVTKTGKRIYDGVDPDYPILPGTYFSGGAGLSSTTMDYAKFLQLFLNKGSFNGEKLLSRKTIEMMLTDQIVDTANEFGLGFGLETSVNDYRSVVSEGTFSWAGAYNTHYWADPKERLIGIIFTNMYNSSRWSIGEHFKILAYQSIAD